MAEALRLAAEPDRAGEHLPLLAFADDDVSIKVLQSIAVDLGQLRQPWRTQINAILTEATLTVPAEDWMRRGGKLRYYRWAQRRWQERPFPSTDRRWRRRWASRISAPTASTPSLIAISPLTFFMRPRWLASI